MSATITIESPCLDVSPDRPTSIDISLPKRRRRIVSASPGTPTPINRTGQRRRLAKVKTRAASTGSLASTLSSSVHSSHQVTDDDPRRGERGATEPPRTPDRCHTVPLRSCYSESSVSTRPARQANRPLGSAITHDVADKKLAREIREFDVTSFNERKRGFNYVFSMSHRDAPEEIFFKVGETTVGASARQRQINSTCGLLGREIQVPGYVPGPYYKKAEKLILAELSPYRYDFECDCDKKHREYIKGVKEAHVIEATQRWTQFCESQPWDAKGKLHPFWEARLCELQAGGSLQNASPKDRAKIWKAFACPKPWTFWLYNFLEFVFAAGQRFLLWMFVVLILIANLSLPPARLLVFLNTCLQVSIMWSYTVHDIQFASSKAHGRGGKCSTSDSSDGRDRNIAPQSGRRGRVANGMEASPVVNRRSGALGTAVEPKPRRPSMKQAGSLPENPIDLSSDNEQ